MVLIALLRPDRGVSKTWKCQDRSMFNMEKIVIVPEDEAEEFDDMGVA